MPDKALCLKAAGFSWEKTRLDLLDLASQSNSLEIWMPKSFWYVIECAEL